MLQSCLARVLLGVILWLYRYRDHIILGLYWDNGKENGNHRDYSDYFGARDSGFRVQGLGFSG